MQYIIDGVRHYRAADNTPRLMFCTSQLMNILAFHCPLFENARTFDLLRAGWSFWYLPQERRLTVVPVLDRFFFNLQALFGATAETISCGSPAQLRDLLNRRLCADRPLFLYVDGMPRLAGGEIEFIEDDRGTHITFAAYGLDSARDGVLLMNNQVDLPVWAPVDIVGHRLVRNRVYDVHVPPVCEMPTEKAIVKLLLDKVRSNDRTFGTVYRLKRYAQRLFQGGAGRAHRDSPPPGAVCGPRGIRAFADRLTHNGRGRAEAVRELTSLVYHSVQSMMRLRQERTVFISLLKDLRVSAEAQGRLDSILTSWEGLAQSWMVASKLGAKFYRTGRPDIIPGFQDRLYCIAEQEEQVLLSLRDYLARFPADSRGPVFRERAEFSAD